MLLTWLIEAIKGATDGCVRDFFVIVYVPELACPRIKASTALELGSYRESLEMVKSAVSPYSLEWRTSLVEKVYALPSSLGSEEYNAEIEYSENQTASTDERITFILSLM